MKLNSYTIFKTLKNEDDAKLPSYSTIGFGVKLEEEHNIIYKFALLALGTIADFLVYSIVISLFIGIAEPLVLLFNFIEPIPPIAIPFIIAISAAVAAISIPVRLAYTIASPIIDNCRPEVTSEESFSL